MRTSSLDADFYISPKSDLSRELGLANRKSFPQEPPRSPILDGEASSDNKGSPVTSFGGIESGVGEKGILHAVPQAPSLDLEAELNFKLAIARADEDRKKEEDRDLTVAKQLEEELKAYYTPVPEDLPDAAPSSLTGTCPSGGGFLSSPGDRQVDKLKAKNDRYKLTAILKTVDVLQNSDVPPFLKYVKKLIWHAAPHSTVGPPGATQGPPLDSNSVPSLRPRQPRHFISETRKVLPVGILDCGTAPKDTAVEKMYLAQKRRSIGILQNVYAFQNSCKCDGLLNLALQWQQRARENHSLATRYYSDARFMQMGLASAQKDIHHLDTELKAAENKLRVVEQQLSDAVSLLEVRGKELEEARPFINKVDTFSIPEVVRKVTALNEEIFRTAAFFGEVLVYEVLTEGADREFVRRRAVSKGYDQAKELLGDVLASTLAQKSMQAPKEPSNQLLVRITMEVALTQWCASLGSRWTLSRKAEREAEGCDPHQLDAAAGGRSPSSLDQAERTLRDLYDSIRNHEDQGISGRWRSYARTHLPFSSDGWDRALMSGVVSVMSIAGWASRTYDEMDQIEQRLGSLFNPLLELRKAIGEDVTSVDLEISTVEPRVRFNPRCMEDAHGKTASNASSAAPDVVVNTSALGLRKLSVKKLQDGATKRQIEILVLPKVVLERTMEEALRT